MCAEQSENTDQSYPKSGIDRHREFLLLMTDQALCDSFILYLFEQRFEVTPNVSSPVEMEMLNASSRNISPHSSTDLDVVLDRL